MIAFSLIRLIVLSVVLFLSLVVLALSAFMASVTGSSVLKTVFDFNALGIADAVITFAIVIPALVIGRMRRGAIFTTLMVEVGWVSFLCIMWLAEAARSADGMPSLTVCELLIFGIGLAGSLGIPDFGGLSDVANPSANDPFNVNPDDLVDSKTKGFCHAWPAVTAFAFLIWITLLGYLITLITLGVRGNHWRTDVSEVGYGPATTNTFNNTGVASNKMQSPGQEKQNYGYPPQQQVPQQQYQQQQVPQQQYQQQQVPQQQYPQQQVPQHTGEYSPYGAGSPAPAHMQQQQV